MQLLVRKINRAKWDQNNICEGESPSGDAITIDLRTKNNTLSIWEINSEDEIEDAVLALTVAGDTLNTIDIVIFNAD